MNTSLPDGLRRFTSKVAPAILCGMALFATVAHATDGSWSTLNIGNWGTTSNWVNGDIADGVDATATFSTAITGSRAITLDSARTIGYLTLSASQQWSFAGAALNLAVSDSASNPTITTSGAGYHLISSTITGTQGFTKTGTGILILRGSNSYSGVTTLNNGSLYVRSSYSLGASGSGNETIVNGNAATAQLHFDTTNGDILSQEDLIIQRTQAGAVNSIYNDYATGVTTLAGSLTLERGGSSSAAHTFGLQVSNGAMVISGAISGKLADGGTMGGVANTNIFRVKTGTGAMLSVSGTISDGTIGNNGLTFSTDSTSTGTVSLTAANTYTGATTHNGGTLLINNASGSGTGTGAVTVASGATFGGTGIVAPTGSNGVSFESGAILAPGGAIVGNASVTSSAGEKLTFSLANTTGSVTLKSGAVIKLDASSNAVDSIAFTGLTAGQSQVVFSDNVVNLTISGGTLSNGLYTIMSFDASNAYTGHLVLGSSFDGLSASLIYNTNSIQLQIGAIPEHASMVPWVILGMAGMYRGWKKAR